MIEYKYGSHNVSYLQKRVIHVIREKSGSAVDRKHEGTRNSNSFIPAFSPKGNRKESEFNFSIFSFYLLVVGKPKNC